MTFTIPGPLVSPGPDKLIVRRGKIYRYPPARNVAYRAHIQRCWRSSGLKGLFGITPLTFTATVRHAIPPSTGARERVRMVDGLHLPIRQPEAANLAAFLCEALTGLAFSHPRQIVRLEVLKAYAAGEPCVTISLAPAEERGVRNA